MPSQHILSPCPKCSTIQPHSAKGLCKRCYSAAYTSAYRRAHPEKKAVYRRAYALAHPEKLAAYHRVYNATHREQRIAHDQAHKLKLATAQRIYRAAHRKESAASTRAWNAAHPGKRSEYDARRRAREHFALVAPVNRDEIFERDRGICGICGKKVAKSKMTLDHIWPLGVPGGTHEPRNVRVAHLSCNRRRQHRGPAQLRLT